MALRADGYKAKINYKHHKHKLISSTGIQLSVVKKTNKKKTLSTSCSLLNSSYTREQGAKITCKCKTWVIMESCLIFFFFFSLVDKLFFCNSKQYFTGCMRLHCTSAHPSSSIWVFPFPSSCQCYGCPL